mmetsp:Transcript_6103/g.12233  ORF Transcript_6103/g.12233 Transcript_6103/m.12233 type:complete len:134 (-) Transcript_6103:1118-1519(-)
MRTNNQKEKEKKRKKQKNKKKKKKKGGDAQPIATHAISNEAELAQLPEEERQLEEMRRLGLPVSFVSTSTMRHKPSNITVQFAKNEEEARFEREYKKLHRSMHTKTRRKRRSEKIKHRNFIYQPFQESTFGMD